MSFYYDNQTRERAESLMEKQHYPVLEEAASEEEDNDMCCDECGGELDEDWNCIDPDCIMCPDYEEEEDDEA